MNNEFNCVLVTLASSFTQEAKLKLYYNYSSFSIKTFQLYVLSC